MQLPHTYGHAPRAGRAYAVSMAINDFTVRRSSDDRFRRGIGRQGGERWTREIDNELLLVGCQCGITATDASLHYPCTGRALHLLHALPMQPVRDVERPA